MAGVLRSCRSRFAAVLIMGALMLGSAPAPVEAGEDAVSFVRAFAAEATATLADQRLTSAERRDAMRSMLLHRFDVAAISRFVLGRHWHAATDQERTAFGELFGDFVVATYGRHMDNYAGESLQVGRAIDKGPRGVFVNSEIIRPGGNPIRLVWRLRRGPEDWRVLDLIVEGVSLALTHRAEADSVIRNGDGRIADLLERMRSLIDKMNA